jgi:hypothetical protein
VFSKKVSFKEAFPQIKDLNVEVTEIGSGTNYKGQTQSYSKADFPGEFIDCSNPLCYNGGFSIGGIIREMVENNQTDIETSKSCRGYEGSPKGKRRYRSCTSFFKIKVHIDYE